MLIEILILKNDAQANLHRVDASEIVSIYLATGVTNG